MIYHGNGFTFKEYLMASSTLFTVCKTGFCAGGGITADDLNCAMTAREFKSCVV